jgi:hypothetical protein
VIKEENVIYRIFLKLMDTEKEELTNLKGQLRIKTKAQL